MMMRVDWRQALRFGVLPVVCLEKEVQVETLIAALSKTPLRCMEILIRCDYAAEAVRLMKARCPDMIVGAGTVLDEETLAAALAAGADFMVSPGLDPAIVAKAQANGLPVIPGCATPSEMMAARRLGCEVVKFFPAEASGGSAALRLLASALEGLLVIPTGGIDMQNLEGYLRCRNVLACGGSFMAKSALIADGDVDGILSLCRESIAIAERAGRTGR